MLVLRTRFAHAGPWLLAGGIFAACTSRDVPARFPETSAASFDAPAGHTPEVTHALADNPPLPGSDQPAGWAGLNEPTAGADAGTTTDPHAHHRGHHAH